MPAFGRGRALASFPASASDPPRVGVCAENGVGGVEVAAPVAMSPELFSPLQTTAPAESGEAALSPSLEAAALPTTADLATPPDWGESMEPEGAGDVGWHVKTSRKRPLSGDSDETRACKEPPPIPLSNRFEGLAGTEEGVDFSTAMDLELELVSPFSYPEPWVPDGFLDSAGAGLMQQGEGDLGDLGGAGDP
ncbi:hypothetical protein AAFF_G00091380 [Aldrovandia affinis]|uniref:Uncharacterized protein n=1 Tax=Aldrovandia affinis TaxID=143900 RepID=A0AAD7VXI6_9TELE|nr:hypothetical protein AAFF_G00091380 [Aldrovandia affinis]